MNTRNVLIHYSMQCFICIWVCDCTIPSNSTQYIHITLPLTSTITTYGEAALLKSSNKMVMLMLMWRWWWVWWFFFSSKQHLKCFDAHNEWWWNFFLEVSLSDACRSTRMYCTNVKCAIIIYVHIENGNYSALFAH